MFELFIKLIKIEYTSVSKLREINSIYFVNFYIKSMEKIELLHVQKLRMIFKIMSGFIRFRRFQSVNVRRTHTVQ